MDQRPCGCPEDYHLADCPIVRPSMYDDLTTEDLLELLDHNPWD